LTRERFNKAARTAAALAAAVLVGWSSARYWGRSEAVEQRSGEPPSSAAAAHPTRGLPPDVARPPGEPVSAQVQEQRLAYDRVFAGDPPSPSAPEWEQTVGMVFDDDEITAVGRPTHHEVQCRATQCRIEAVFGAGDDGDEWTRRVLIALADGFDRSRTVSQVLPTGETAITVYALRKGAAAAW
jgi:hypothetical protein